MISDSFSSHLLRQYRSMGKSIDNRFFLQFRYDFKIPGKSKRQISYFSIVNSRIKNEEQLLRYLDFSIENFKKVQDKYSTRGLTDINISGISLVAYGE